MEEKDRDEARKQQIADLTMRQMDQKHAQDMDKGALEIELQRSSLKSCARPSRKSPPSPRKARPSRSASRICPLRAGPDGGAGRDHADA
jgi:hypothetical protein